MYRGAKIQVALYLHNSFIILVLLLLLRIYISSQDLGMHATNLNKSLIS